MKENERCTATDNVDIIVMSDYIRLSVGPSRRVKISRGIASYRDVYNENLRRKI